MIASFRQWLGTGSPWVWLTAGAVGLSLVMVFGLLILIAANGLAHFWPAAVLQFEHRTSDGTRETVLGEIVDRESVPASRVRAVGGLVPEGATTVERVLVKVGNRDIGGSDFRWFPQPELSGETQPADAVVIERSEWGNLYGFVREVREAGKAVPGDWRTALAPRLARRHELHAQIRRLQSEEIGAVNYELERLRLVEKRDGASTVTKAEKQRLGEAYEALAGELAKRVADIDRDSLLFVTAGGQEREIPLAKIVRVYMPNAMSFPEKLVHYFAKLWEFVAAEPREANTEGGVFPAIFGTVLMVIIMSIFVTPFGVIAAVYLREYARPGPVTSAIRIAVNNLAGVPSVVYGVFGFGFFVYFVGGSIDRAFFADKLPSPTFGTPGLLWSSLTLALLTVPVVIVATEEGLTRIPRAIREGSLALGATKAETLWRTVLPMATPAMMTGLILAVARAAGEVAPLMMVGVVKLAPALPLDGNFPYLHLDRKFMHLGFHIYDVGFQSPNVEAARPLVYSTALLLVAIIMSLNLAAIRIRNRLREKYNGAET
ncbi:MAG: phosphate ABC transporter permease PstA [Gammaproteobacteria bacterium]